MTPHELASACAEAMWAEDRASRGLAMTLEAVSPGRALIAMEVLPPMANGHGICHGGFIFTLADSAMAFAANSHGERAVAHHAAIIYLRPVRVGDTLLAEALERVRSGRSGLYDVQVVGANGETVAEFRGHTRLSGGRFFPET